jgi:hypothetical protein
MSLRTIAIGAAAGAAAGAAVGLIFPVVGTVIGLIAGGVGGALLGGTVAGKTPKTAPATNTPDPGPPAREPDCAGAVAGQARGQELASSALSLKSDQPYLGAAMPPPGERAEPTSLGWFPEGGPVCPLLPGEMSSGPGVFAGVAELPLPPQPHTPPLGAPTR